MRTQGILLVKDAVFFITLCSTNGGSFFPAPTSADPCCLNTGVKPAEWHQMCDKLVTRLDEYSHTLLRNQRRFLEVGDRHGAEIIQSSCVACLAHLAELCNLVSGLELEAANGRDL